MVTTVYAIIKHCLFKFVYQSTIVFLPVWEMVILFIAINKDILLLRITYYSGLEILLVRSSTSQICEFVDLLFRGVILLFVQLSKNITKYLITIIIHIFSTHFAINLFDFHNLKTLTNCGQTTAPYMWTNKIKIKTIPRHVIFRLTSRSIARFSPQTMQWYH